ncbi:helix-turn-helix domain-containing protein [Streptomyces sp. NPDC057638]|uniref:helix-turn-helix domain-containing protein n=1 Tax=Streptomyces sp. NPDC057638 TaxID=3346190 RepID=UPI0036869557
MGEEVEVPRSRKVTPEKSARDLFGAKLRGYREGAGLSLEALGRQVAVGKSHLSRIEVADYMPPPELPPTLDALFRTGGTFAELYELCVREIHPNQFRRMVDLEARAAVIRQYSGLLVPGLLQTEAYTRAHIIEHDPSASAETIDELVAARQVRQARLEAEGGPETAFILDEAALRCGFGGPAAWREQLARLVDAADTPRGIVQMMPSEFCGHALVGGSLLLMRMRDGSQVAWEESISTGTLLEESRVVLRLERAYHRLTARAWSPAKTAAHIRSLMEELPS